MEPLTKPRALLTVQGCLDMIADYLDLLAIEATIEADGEKAFDLFCHHSFDIVIGLPCKYTLAIKRICSGTVVIATSSWLHAERARSHWRVLVRGFDAHLILPFSLSELVATISRAAMVCGREDLRAYVHKQAIQRMCRHEPWPICQRYDETGQLRLVY